jgi:hypothetical protein
MKKSGAKPVCQLGSLTFAHKNIQTDICIIKNQKQISFRVQTLFD